MSEKPINAGAYMNKIEGSPGEFTGGFYEDRPNANYNVSVQPPTASDPSEEMYPCMDCGTLRTKAEGGTTFSVCDNCWDKIYVMRGAPLTVSEEVRQRAANEIFEMLDPMFIECANGPYDVQDFAGELVDAVLAVLRAGRSEGDAK